MTPFQFALPCQFTCLLYKHSPYTVARSPECVGLTNLVGGIKEVDGYADWLGVVVGVPQQDGHDLHAGWPCLPPPTVHGSLQGPLAKHSILAHLTPTHKHSSDHIYAYRLHGILKTKQVELSYTFVIKSSGQRQWSSSPYVDWYIIC